MSRLEDCERCWAPASLEVGSGLFGKRHWCAACVPDEDRGRARAYPPDMPRGRPPKDGETMTERVPLRAGPDQVAAWRAAAEAEGDDLSTWVRETLDTAAAAVLAKGGR